MQRLTRPLIGLDAGWLYLAAGLALCAAAVLLPAAIGLADLQRQSLELRRAETVSSRRLAGYSEFLDALQRDDPALVRRLAAAQLNLRPADDQPLLISSTSSDTERQWIDATVHVPLAMPAPTSPSLLERWVQTRGRTWLLGGGALLTFAGLMMGSFPTRRRARGEGIAHAPVYRVTRQRASNSTNSSATPRRIAA